MKRIQITTKQNEVIIGDLDAITYHLEASGEGVWVFIRNCSQGMPQQGFNVRNAVKKIEMVDAPVPTFDRKEEIIRYVANLLPPQARDGFMETIKDPGTVGAAVSDAFCYIIEQWAYKADYEQRMRKELAEQLKGKMEWHPPQLAYMNTVGEDVEMWMRDGEMVLRMGNGQWYHTKPPRPFSREEQEYAESVRGTMTQMKRNDS